MQVDPQLLQSISIIVAICSIVLAFIVGVQSIRNASVRRRAAVFISYQAQAYDKQFLVDHLEFIDWSWKDYGEFMQYTFPLMIMAPSPMQGSYIQVRIGYRSMLMTLRTIFSRALSHSRFCLDPHL